MTEKDCDPNRSSARLKVDRLLYIEYQTPHATTSSNIAVRTTVGCSKSPVIIPHIDAPFTNLNSLSDPERVMTMD